MMPFLEINIPIEKIRQEELIAFLSNIEYDSFLQEKDHIIAYIEEDRFNLDDLNKILESFEIKNFEKKVLEDQNWNKKWEENFQSIEIKNKLQIRVPFHPSLSFPHEIIMEPKMAFGTGHHSTTAQICEIMMDLAIEGKDVLDLGAGTGVLAILAKQRGAGHIKAIDFDQWSIYNMIENFELNACPEIEAIKGDLSDESFVNSLFEDQKDYKIILANINRNLLLGLIPMISKLLTPNSILITSGYIQDDEAKIIECSNDHNFSMIARQHHNNWMVNTFTKQ